MRVMAGKRPARPLLMSNDVWLVTQRCWDQELSKRPNAEIVAEAMDAVRQGLPCDAVVVILRSDVPSHRTRSPFILCSTPQQALRAPPTPPTSTDPLLARAFPDPLLGECQDSVNMLAKHIPSCRASHSPYRGSDDGVNRVSV